MATKLPDWGPNWIRLSHGFQEGRDLCKSVADQAVSAGRDIKDQAIASRRSSETIKIRLRNSSMPPRTLRRRHDKLKQTVMARRVRARSMSGALPDTIRRAAKDLMATFPSPELISGRRHRKSKV